MAAEDNSSKEFLSRTPDFTSGQAVGIFRSKDSGPSEPFNSKISLVSILSIKDYGTCGFVVLYIWMPPQGIQRQ